MPYSSEVEDKLSTRVLRHLASREAWNADILLIAFGIYTFTSIAFDALRTQLFDPNWILVWFVSFAIAAAAAWLVVKILPKGLWSNEAGGFAVNVGIAMYVGAVKGTLTFAWAAALGLDHEDWDPFIRLFGGAILGLGIFVLAGSLTASRVGHEQVMFELLRRQSELTKLKGDVTVVASKTQNELLRQAQASLLPQIDYLKSGLGNRIGAKEIVVSLQTLVEKHVRPLSRSLSLDAEKLAAGPIAEPAPVKGWQLPNRLDIAKAIFPIPVYFVILPTQFLMTEVMHTPLDLVQLMLGCTLTLLSLFLMREIWPKKVRLDWAGGAVSMLAISLICGLPEAWYLYNFIPDSSPMKAMSMATLIAISFITNAALMTTVLMDQSRVRVRAELRKVNATIDRELAIFDQRVWLQKRRWSYLLHGTVAAKLTAASLKLQTTPSDDALDEVSGLLDEIVGVVTTAEQAEIELRVELDNLITTWRGLMKVSVEIETKAWRVLDTDQNASMAINEICREATNNAVRHGEASELHIEISNPEDGDLVLRISNNGIFPRVKAKGLGLQMMDALTSNWGFSRSTENGFVLMTAVVPYSIG